MKHKVYTTYQASKMCKMHHTTIINWINKGKLIAYTTPGGHRRINKNDLMDFMKKYKIPFSQEIIDERKEKNIICVDDDIDILNEYKEALSGRGFKLDFASDGFEAATKILKKRPDVIILDFKMPGMNGFRVCDILKEDKNTADIPIIAVTVLSSEEDIERIKSYENVIYLSKPVDIELLLENILQVTDREIMLGSLK